MYECRSIAIIAHQCRAIQSIVVRTLFISIASFDCFSLLIVRGGLWRLSHTSCYLCWQALHLFTESLNQILVLRLQKAQQRWKGGGTRVFNAPGAFVFSGSYFSLFMNNTASHCEAAVFTALLKAVGRCISPSVLTNTSYYYSHH